MSVVNNVFELRIDRASLDFFGVFDVNIHGYIRSDGHFSIVLTDPDVPKFATASRTGGTAEENKTAMVGSIGYFGTYTVSEPDKTVYLRVVASTFPNWRGSDQKRVATLSGDDLTWTNPTPSIGAGNATLVWKRAKPTSRQTAQK